MGLQSAADKRIAAALSPRDITVAKALITKFYDRTSQSFRSFVMPDTIHLSGSVASAIHYDAKVGTLGKSGGAFPLTRWVLGLVDLVKGTVTQTAQTAARGLPFKP